jgi:hypothetical protein
MKLGVSGRTWGENGLLFQRHADCITKKTENFFFVLREGDGHVR